MADITIKLVYQLETGKQDLYIDFVSDDDALPIEHEREHKKIIEALIGQGVLKPDQLGEVKVQRLRGQHDLSQVSPARQEQAHHEREAQKQR